MTSSNSDTSSSLPWLTHIYKYSYGVRLIHIYIYIHTYPPTSSVVRVRLHLLAYNIQSLSNSHPSKQGPEEDISPASPGSQAAEIEESYPPGTQAAGIQDLGARMLKSRDLSILSSSIGDLLRRNSLPQAATGCQLSVARTRLVATGRHRMPTFWLQNPANLPKSVLPPAQE